MYIIYTYTYIYTCIYIYIYIYKTSVCISKNLKWLNEQVKKVRRYDTRPVSRPYDFQV